jgi:hypothetical protein
MDSGKTPMSKNKKKTPKVDPRLLAHPRLAALLNEYGAGALNKVELQAALTTLLAEVGPPLLAAMVKRLETASVAVGAPVASVGYRQRRTVEPV